MKRIVYFFLLAILLVFPSVVSSQVLDRYGDIVLRQGTNVWVRFPDNLDSDRNRNGDQFQAILDQNLVSNGSVLARAGSSVFFRLVDVQAGGPNRDRSRVSLTLTGIQVESSVIPIETNTITVATVPNRNQKLNFRIERSTTFNARSDRSGAMRGGEPGRIDEIARELNSRAQYMLETIRGGREETWGRTPDGTSNLNSAMGRFANDTRTFEASRNFRNAASRQAATSLVSQAEQISRLMVRGNASSRFGNDWGLVEDQVGRLSQSFGLQYTPASELTRDDNRTRRGRELGPVRSAADHGTFYWRGRVDGSDYIELRNDRVTVRHMQAQPIAGATYDVRSPLPRQPVNVQLNKLRGRGNVVLTQQPSAANGYTAIVYIEDNEGGNDLYEFELSW